MKKLVTLVLALMVLVSGVSAFAIYDIPEAYEMPICTDGSITLTIYMAMESGSEKAMIDYTTHPAIVKWEEATGIDVNFIHPPKNDDGTYFNTVIASGVLPDIFVGSMFTDWYAGGVQGAIDDGVLIDLNPYIEQYGYYYLTEAHTNWDEDATRNFMTDEGMYRFGAASQRVPVLGKQHNGMVVRGDVLTELGIDVPQTIDEVHDMLLALKDYGFEVPLALEKLTSSYYYSGNFLSSWLGITTNKFMLDEEGKVTWSLMQPEYKEYISMLKQWYQEGLIDVDSISRTHSDAEAMVTSGRSAMVCIGNWETQEDIAVLQSATGNENATLLGLTAPVATEADIGSENPFTRPIINGENTMYWGISSQCEHPVEAFKMLDWLYSYEGTELMVFGPTEYTDMLNPDNGVVTIHWTNEDGTREFSDYILNNDALEYNSIRYIYTIQNLSSEYASEMEYMQYSAECNEQCWEAWTANATDDRMVPACITLTAEESTTQVNTLNAVESYIFEKLNNIVFGDDTVDNWDSYIEQCKSMGIEDVIAIQQAATDRYYAR